jgi:hypothetical protein
MLMPPYSAVSHAMQINSKYKIPTVDMFKGLQLFHFKRNFKTVFKMFLLIVSSFHKYIYCIGIYVFQITCPCPAAVLKFATDSSRHQKQGS